MTKYSVAIRTLGTNPDLLRKELESIFAQTVKPEKVMIYIAHGYPCPDFRVDSEQYVYVDKGMVTQRSLRFTEIDTPLILLIDDDVLLSPDSAERLIRALEEGGYDSVAPDTYANHKMTGKQKVYSALTNLVFPHRSQKWAFRVKWNGSFSYINRPAHGGCYPTQSAAGPCSLWRRDRLLDNHIDHELWLDRMGYPYLEDQITFYKMYSNGFRIGVLFDSGVDHVGGMSSSAGYHKSPQAYIIRAKAIYVGWHRSLYNPETNKLRRLGKGVAFWGKCAWAIVPHAIAGIVMRRPKIPFDFIKGLREGIKYTHTDYYRDLPAYIYTNKI